MKLSPISFIWRQPVDLNRMVDMINIVTTSKYVFICKLRASIKGRRAVGDRADKNHDIYSVFTPRQKCMYTSMQHRLVNVLKYASKSSACAARCKRRSVACSSDHSSYSTSGGTDIFPPAPPGAGRPGGMAVGRPGGRANKVAWRPSGRSLRGRAAGLPGGKALGQSSGRAT